MEIKVNINTKSNVENKKCDCFKIVDKKAITIERAYGINHSLITRLLNEFDKLRYDDYINTHDQAIPLVHLLNDEELEYAADIVRAVEGIDVKNKVELIEAICNAPDEKLGRFYMRSIASLRNGGIHEIQYIFHIIALNYSHYKKNS